MNRKLIGATAAFVVAGVLIVAGFVRFFAYRPVEKQLFDVMDTVVVVRAYGWNASKGIDRALSEISRLDKMLSAYDEGSEVYEINKNAGIAPVKVSPETMYLVTKALEYAEISNGAFDPTVLPLMSLWGFGGDNYRVPSNEEIAETLKVVNYRLVKVDQAAGTVFLEKAGMALDLGAIAKGYAVDRMAEALRASKVSSFLINAGGNVLVGGPKPGNKPWRVAIKDPANTDDYIAIYEGTEMSIVNSGDYERFFVENGIRYHHIMDPRTGYPARVCHGTAIISKSSTVGDALSTTTFILGPEGSQEVLKKFPEVGVLFMTTDGALVKAGAPGLVDTLQFK